MRSYKKLSKVMIIDVKVKKKVMMNVQNFQKKHLVGNDRYRKVCCQKWLFPKGKLYPRVNNVDMVSECTEERFRRVVPFMIGPCIGSTIASSIQ